MRHSSTAERSALYYIFLDLVSICNVLDQKPNMVEEGSLSHQEALRFRGLARVDLANLNFEFALAQGHRNLEQRNVARLLGIFRTHGYERYASGNFVKVRVDAGFLDAALTLQGFCLL